jgi:hypothetical protein
MGYSNQQVDRMGIKFLKAMKVEPSYFNIFSSLHVHKDYFHNLAAVEIIKKLFGETKLEKLANLMTKLGEKEPSLIGRASTEIDQIIKQHEGTSTGKIFRKIKQKFPATLNLLGIVKIKQENFQTSYNLFYELLTQLNIPHASGGRLYETITIVNYFSAALEDLEEFVKDTEQKENNYKPESTEQGQGEEANNPNKKPETNSSEQDKTSPPKESPPSQNNNQNQGLEKLRARAITKISQVMQEAKITDQDLSETDRQ